MMIIVMIVILVLQIVLDVIIMLDTNSHDNSHNDSRLARGPGAPFCHIRLVIMVYDIVSFIIVYCFGMFVCY